MIVYETNKNWFKDIRNLTTSWTMQKIMRGVLLIGLLSSIICFGLFYFSIEPRLHSGIFSLLGVVLSILLVFRTNSAYDRWWEGRKHWGALVNNTRNLAVMLKAYLPEDDKPTKQFFARNISNFCFALRDHLRQGVRMDELDLTAEEEAELTPKAHKPNHIAYWIFQKIHTLYKADVISEADMINIKAQHESLLDILGACERIKKTPIPFSYAVYIKIFVSAYCVMLPFGLYLDFGFYTIPLTMFISFAMIGLELMAQEIEEPFGLDCNDLPTGDIAKTIQRNVFELLTERVTEASKPKESYTKVF
ncbi:MAG: bestrophin family protein [Cyclobacteriaceae bacterium]